ncbi:MAG: TIGR03936 family radical SAM-associated protein [Egibacteraceae bacterium]
MRVRIRYEKTGKLRFISAIDLGRVWERALRRADLPIAFSEGFSPHPKVSFTDALPLGYASTGEYAELTFAAPILIGRTVSVLNDAFPPGMRVSHAVEVAVGAPKLAKWLYASCWDMAYGDVPALTAAADAVKAATALPVARERKGPAVTVDLRPAIHTIIADGGLVRVILHHVEPPVRPSEVHQALERCQPGIGEPALITRVAQGSPGAEGLIEALSGDLVPSGPWTDRRSSTPPAHPLAVSASPGRLGPTDQRQSCDRQQHHDYQQ